MSRLLSAFRRRPCQLVLAAAVWGLPGCTPELNWREIRPTGDLVLMFPCKPSVESRTVNLAGVEVKMEMHVCEAQGVTYALAHADLADPSRSAAALKEMRASLSSKVRGAPTKGDWVPAGATPSDSAGRQHVSGSRPDGQHIEQDAAFFLYGTRVFQAVAMGSQRSEEAGDTFFESIEINR